MAKQKITAAKICELIKSQAKLQGLNINALAKKVGIDTTTIYRMLSGHDTGYIKVLKILNALGITVTLKKPKKKKKAKK